NERSPAPLLPLPPDPPGQEGAPREFVPLAHAGPRPRAPPRPRRAPAPRRGDGDEAPDPENTKTARAMGPARLSCFGDRGAPRGRATQRDRISRASRRAGARSGGPS